MIITLREKLNFDPFHQRATLIYRVFSFASQLFKVLVYTLLSPSIAHRWRLYDYHRHTDWHGRTLLSFPCFLCTTETCRCFCKLGLVSSRKELGELSISLCVLLPCSSKLLCVYGLWRRTRITFGW